MRNFLDSNVDAIITDEILMAETVQAELDERSDMQVLRARLSSVWK